MTSPVAKAGMLIRRPLMEVFNAFIDPEVTTRFWFTAASGKLEPGRRVRWTWGMYGASMDVRAKEIEPGRRILIDWAADTRPREVEWTFEQCEGGVFVEVVDRGFGTGDDELARAIDSTGGFTLALAGAKIWLEHGIDPGFVIGRHPAAVLPGWSRD